MTGHDFRRVALKLPGTIEGSHMGHPDFRAGGKIFATLDYPTEGWGMVKLSPEQQDDVLHAQPAVFVAVKGAWGRQGATNVRLETVGASTLEKALRLAWSYATSASKRTAAVRKRAKSTAKVSS